MPQAKKFVIDLGGSVAFPGKVDVKLLNKFCFLIKKEVQRGNKFIIVVGGGPICRMYQKAASQVAKIPDKEKDLLGIYVTRLNAYFLKTTFQRKADPVLFDQRFKFRTFGQYPVLVACGWQPGRSTDFVACQIAVDFNINQVIMLGKPDYVYTADPAKDKNARPIKEMSWQEYFRLIPAEWTPGLNVPVDPIAARLAKRIISK